MTINQSDLKRKSIETLAGATVGAMIGGPVGAVAGGLAAHQVEAGASLLRATDQGTPQPAGTPLNASVLAHPKRILVPVDFSQPSRDALRFAGEWARVFGAELDLVHVVDPGASLFEFGVVPGVSMQHAFSEKAAEALEELRRTELPEGLPVQTAVRQGKPYDQIAMAAQERATDLIIIATHSSSELKHTLLGSTAERVARHAPCPVLVLRQAQPSQPADAEPSDSPSTQKGT